MPVNPPAVRHGLFAGQRMFDYLANRHQAARRAVDAMPSVRILGGDIDELARELFDRVQVRAIEFDYERMYQDEPAEVEHATRDPAGNFIGERRGTLLLIHLPFSGDEDLLHVTPSNHDGNPLQARVQDNEAVLICGVSHF